MRLPALRRERNPSEAPRRRGGGGSIPESVENVEDMEKLKALVGR